MAEKDPMTRPRDTSLASEHIPSERHPMAEENFDAAKDKPPHRQQAPKAVRQDGMLGDISPRDETTH